jgi:outer membrane receptor protein involved in Fe transport
MALLPLATAFPVLADTRGSVRGVVTDPSGAIVIGARVEMTSLLDGRKRMTTTDAEGEYAFGFEEVGHYRLIAAAPGFQPVETVVTIISGQQIEANLKFAVATGPTEEITVTSAESLLDLRNAAVQAGYSKSDIEHLAGGSESNAALEAHTGTAWRSQEHLHIRGAHQIGYQVNGLSVPDLSIFGPITPLVDPRNLKYVEVTTGGLLPEFGNRTAGVVNTITRSGFDADERGRIEFSGGNLRRGSIYASFGDRVSDKFAYYVQGTTLTSGRGFNPPPDVLSPLDLDGDGKGEALQSPRRQTRHNHRRTFQAFGNFEWRPTARDSCQLVLGGFRSDFQIPNTIAEESVGRDYVQFERDHFQSLQWTRVLSGDRLLTVGGYHHHTKLEIDGRADGPGLPLASDNRRADYYGGKADFSARAGKHFLKVGGEVYGVRLRDDFSVIANPRRDLGDQFQSVSSKVPARAVEASVYAQDQFDVTDRLTLTYGGRLDLFFVRFDLQTQPDIRRRDEFFSPRLGFAYRLGGSQTVIFGNAAYLFLPPPIEFFELPPASQERVNRPSTIRNSQSAGVSFTPVVPEKDVQYDLGVRFLVKGFRGRVTQWFKRQNRFLDHIQLAQFDGAGQLINPNIFLPVNLDRARTHGVEAQVEAPSYRGLQVRVNYSLNYAQAIGGVIHGFHDGSPPEKNYFFLDHDQRHQVYVGVDYHIEPLDAFVNATYSFGSGFPDASDGLFGACVTKECRLPKHSVLNVAFGKVFAKRIDARLEVENVTNAVYPINLGSEFNGSHVSLPRQITLRLGYRF